MDVLQPSPTPWWHACAFLLPFPPPSSCLLLPFPFPFPLCLPLPLIFPSAAFISAQMLKGHSRLFPKQRIFGATHLTPEQSSTQSLLSQFARLWAPFWLGFPAAMGFPFLLFVNWENVVEAVPSQLCPSGRIYLWSFQHSVFSTSIIICFFLQDQGDLLQQLL